MKFINYLESISGVGIYPLISLLVFFIFFSALSIWVFKVDKKYINTVKHIPFSPNEIEK